MPYQRPYTPIGRRRERVTIQTASSTTDGMGGQVLTWSTLAQPFAQVTPLDQRDQEAVRGDALTVTHNYHIDMRYRIATVPTPKMRIVWRTKTLEVTTVVDDDQLKRRLIVQAAEVQ